MGMNDNNILDELVSDLSFQPFTINLQKISIVIHSIGILAKQEAECEFASSFIYFTSKERILVFQTVNKDRFSVCIYKGNQISEEYCGSDPNSENDCQIIELQSQLALLYPDSYIFSEREIQAWRAMLCATGCINITPFGKEESEVGCQIANCKKLVVKDWRDGVIVKDWHDGVIVKDWCDGIIVVEHTLDCDECNKIFKLFEELRLLLGNKQQEVLKELQSIRWFVTKLQDELNRRNIYFDTTLGRDKLINLLKREMGEKTYLEESNEEFQ
ncbi:8115_t:CDS:2 [Gigaspora rosea]|nr:8115_t:CDS:2 [Gigaspora rosea]